MVTHPAGLQALAASQSGLYAGCEAVERDGPSTVRKQIDRHTDIAQRHTDATKLHTERACEECDTARLPEEVS